MAIEMKMEFLNNDGAHNLCEQDSNNFICVNLSSPLALVLFLLFVILFFLFGLLFVD